ncbi:MAG: TIR domain-containing protein [Flavobacteriaceae bacterium]|nr:TIR domain-containing protein [Flavobacteriaceae bacterium]MCY4215586.1 TIR domain-containing protein [Flavobacteriaceae bacterium]MCY4253203.1 TIR domain-containing protein [Flavobacteriaceae bacterium]
MGKKIFVSYKYADTLVERLSSVPIWKDTTPRDYLNIFENTIEDKDDIYKGESDDEDIGDLSKSTIEDKLKDRIYDSTVTVVLISKGMEENSKSEKEQWIPWEISYSLKEISRGGRTSLTNAVLAVVLPEDNGSYDYFVQKNVECDCQTLITSFLFPIMRKNMFNIKNPNTRECNNLTIYSGQPSYIYTVVWKDFISNYKRYIDAAISLFDKRDRYNISKELED